MSKEHKICIVIYSMGGGGAERVISTLANHWLALGNKITVVTFIGREHDVYHLPPMIDRIALDEKISGFWIRYKSLSFMRRVIGLRNIIKEKKIDVVVAMMSASSITSILAATGLDVPVIISERIYPPMLNIGRVWNLLRKLTYPRADLVVVQTKKTSDWLAKNIPKSIVSIIPNAVTFPLQSSNPTVDTKITGKNKVMLAVGRIDKQKNFFALVSAFKIAIEKNDGWELYIAGEGPERQALEEEIARSGDSAPFIHLLGRVGNISDWYKASDIYVMSSLFEGFPNTLIEAMSYGCPAISYSCDAGPEDIILDGVDGILVKNVGCIVSLADAMSELMNDDCLRNKLAKNAELVKQRLSEDKVFALWDCALRRVINE